MSEIKIRTWSCLACGYKQDFEPTKENQDIHFNNDGKFAVNNLKENECPACSLKGKQGSVLIKETDPAKKSKMTFLNEAEYKALIISLETESPQMKADGVEFRDETLDEKVYRIDKELAEANLSSSEKIVNRAELLALPPRKIQTLKMRQELPFERRFRIEQIKNKIKPLTEAEIIALRAKYEDA